AANTSTSPSPGTTPPPCRWRSPSSPTGSNAATPTGTPRPGTTTGRASSSAQDLRWASSTKAPTGCGCASPPPRSGRSSAAAPSRSPDGRIMKVGVTGGAGFIGGHVVETLTARVLEPLVFDHHNRRLHRDDVEVLLGDVRDETAVFELA